VALSDGDVSDRGSAHNQPRRTALTGGSGINQFPAGRFGQRFQFLRGMSVAKSAIAARSIELEPIDRLEEKVKLLVGMVDRLRAENAVALEENAKLTRELESSRARLADAESTGSEILTLREERDLIRSRVDEMLQQIEGLNL
jgi:regulator of replication initiation timing